jgi:hypothetical protein
LRLYGLKLTKIGAKLNKIGSLIVNQGSNCTNQKPLTKMKITMNFGDGD